MSCPNQVHHAHAGCHEPMKWHRSHRWSKSCVLCLLNIMRGKSWASGGTYKALRFSWCTRTYEAGKSNQRSWTYCWEVAGSVSDTACKTSAFLCLVQHGSEGVFNRKWLWRLRRRRKSRRRVDTLGQGLCCLLRLAERLWQSGRFHRQTTACWLRSQWDDLQKPWPLRMDQQTLANCRWKSAMFHPQVPFPWLDATPSLQQKQVDPSCHLGQKVFSWHVDAINQHIVL